MSVIAAKVDKENKTIYIASDSIALRGQTQRRFSKLEKINEMIIGGVGFTEENSLMFRYAQTHRPETATEKDVLAFIVEFLSWKREYLNTSGGMDNNFLLAYDGHLFMIEKLFVKEITNYEAIGAGEDYALAALYLGHSAHDAVRVACELCCYVTEPIVQYEMKMVE